MSPFYRRHLDWSSLYGLVSSHIWKHPHHLYHSNCLKKGKKKKKNSNMIALHVWKHLALQTRTMWPCTLVNTDHASTGLRPVRCGHSCLRGWVRTCVQREFRKCDKKQEPREIPFPAERISHWVLVLFSFWFSFI